MVNQSNFLQEVLSDPSKLMALRSAVEDESSSRACGFIPDMPRWAYQTAPSPTAAADSTRGRATVNGHNVFFRSLAGAVPDQAEPVVPIAQTSPLSH
jgi:hypothetical protein